MNLKFKLNIHKTKSNNLVTISNVLLSRVEECGALI